MSNLKIASTLVKELIQNNRRLVKQGKRKNALQIVGEKGIGKSSIPQQIAESMGIGFRVINAGELADKGEIAGFPIKKYEIVKPAKENAPKIQGEEILTLTKSKKTLRKRIVEEKQLPSYIETGWVPINKDPMLSAAIPEKISTMGESGILCIDDWTRADGDILQSLMELIRSSETNGWKLPDDWHIVLTANPDNGEYHVSSIDQAQEDRYYNINVEFDVNAWAEWAVDYGINDQCISFLMMHPEVVTGTGEENSLVASPRKWVMFFDAIEHIKDFTKEYPYIDRWGSSTIPEELVHIFMKFVKEGFMNLSKPEDLILNMSDEEAIKNLKETIGEGYEKDHSKASILGMRLINWIIRYSKNNTISKDIANRIVLLLSSDVFGADIVQIIASKIYNEGRKNRNKFVKIISHKEFNKYISQYA